MLPIEGRISSEAIGSTTDIELESIIRLELQLFVLEKLMLPKEADPILTPAGEYILNVKLYFSI